MDVQKFSDFLCALCVLCGSSGFHPSTVDSQKRFKNLGRKPQLE